MPVNQGSNHPGNEPAPGAIVIGDEHHTREGCRAKFDNVMNFGGFPPALPPVVGSITQLTYTSEDRHPLYDQACRVNGASAERHTIPVSREYLEFALVGLRRLNADEQKLTLPNGNTLTVGELLAAWTFLIQKT